MKKIVFLSLIFCSLAQGANEIRSFTNCSAAFAVVREIDGDVWYVSGQVFEAWGTSARTALDYDIALTAETGGMFTGTFDTNIGAGQYYVVTHDDADSTPADADPAVWQEYGDWDGSIWTPGTFSPADIESEVNDALVALNLDHLMKTAVASNANMEAEVTDGTVLSNIMTAGSDTSDYVVAGDSLEALSDRQVLIKLMTDLIAIYSTTVTDANDANNFVIGAGPADGNDLNDHLIMVIDADDGAAELKYIFKWDVGRDVTVEAPFGFTPANGDLVYVMGTSYGGYFEAVWSFLRRMNASVYIFDQTGGSPARLGVMRFDPLGIDP